MEPSYLMEISQTAIFVCLKIALPPMLIALAVGVTIGLLQALTQIQEMTLSFVPKIVILFLSLTILMPFMTTTLIEYTKTLADKIATISQVDK